MNKHKCVLQACREQTGEETEEIKRRGRNGGREGRTKADPFTKKQGEKKEMIVRAEKDSLLNDGGEEKKRGSRQRGGTGACHGSARRQWWSDAASIRVIPPRLTCLLGEKCDAKESFL